MTAHAGVSAGTVIPRDAASAASRWWELGRGWAKRQECPATAYPECQTGPIDAVITWVDGEDPAHRAKLEAYLTGLGSVPEIANCDRYRESGEFAYCIASLLRFAPWLRRIHIVTDAQEPSFMAALRQSAWRDRVVVVDHTTLLAGHEENLPTFNNRTLLSALWRIPGLAPRFVYLNDDFMLLRPTDPDDFFRGGQVVLRGRWCLQPWHRALAEAAQRLVQRIAGRSFGGEPRRPSYHAGQSLAARRAGFRLRYFRVPHAPHAQLRPLFTAHFARHPEHFTHNIRHRLRSAEQYLGDALGNHLALRRGLAVVDNSLRTLRLKPSHYRAAELGAVLRRAADDERTAFACFQSLESVDPERRALLLGWLESRIGRPEVIFRGELVPAGN